MRVGHHNHYEIDNKQGKSQTTYKTNDIEYRINKLINNNINKYVL